MNFDSYKNETKIKKWSLIQVRPPANQMNDRQIVSNIPDMAVPDNKITTSKYSSIITFIPLNLIEQFSKLVNFYFLFIVIMQMIPSISITNGQPVIMGPLSIFIFISMIKDFVEDNQKHKSDNDENNRKTYLIRANEAPKEVIWSQLRIGDLIKVQKDEQIPADILIIQTSDKKGNVFIDTKNLDGDTILKLKNIPKNLQYFQEQSQNALSELRMTINYERPNPYLYQLTGSAEINSQQVSLSHKNFLLRGCVLRNVDYIYGIVCYNGHDSKIMLNQVKIQPKSSHLERTMNQYVIAIFLFQITICGLGGYLNSYWQQIHNSQLSYLDILNTDLEYNFIKNLFIKWGNWILILANFVPISLIVSLEIVQYFQGILINMDQGTYSAENDIRSVVQSSNLIGQLGQVDYIFSDKTGTLTKNQMDFKCLSVNEKSYGKEVTLTTEEVSKLSQVSNVDFRDKAFFDDLNQNPGMGPLHEFLLCLSLCHTTITEKKNGQLFYQASSSDELALINFARYCDYTFERSESSKNIVVNIRGDIKNYQLLHVFEFDSIRKRMSVIVQDESNQIILYTKGADSIIRNLMKPNALQLQEKTWNDLQEFASIGLRTLLLTKRILPLQIYKEWEISYLQACAAVENRDNLMTNSQTKIEQELELIGGTAVGDQLQEDVGQTIQYLKDAGIKVWVMTGDKIETAINFGYSCQLLNNSLQQFIVDGSNEEIISNQLEKAIQKSQNNNNNALVISGNALIIAMKPEISSKLMQIAERCEAVVACRVSPKQKQEIVSLVRQNKPNVTTLAIGDGANDVNMITAAHIGIGIKGVEGQQAARASDYSIGEFRILKRLILYHGRESYRKNSNLIYYNFYKNILLVLPQYWWAVNNGFSAVMFYDQLLYQSYNLIFTSLPIIFYGIFDEEFSGDILTSNPSFYKIGIKHKLFNTKIFLYWVLNGTIQAAFLSYITFQTYEISSIYNGMMTGLWTTGAIVLGYSVFISNIKIILISNTYSIGVIMGLLASVFIYILLFIFVSEKMANSDIFNSYSISFSNLRFNLTSLLVIGATSILDFSLIKLVQWSQYAHVEIQHDKVYMPIKKQHIELQDEQQLNQPFPNTQFQMNNQSVSKGSIKKGQINLALSSEDN
ncbi:unnamed protein product [Paramecium pentaurelia]|uniref:Phospholipid-transporting ATPase n=1 Tax=Paramecium pentaurelia TaxID=43138 RepID=A0A8S1U871_9CILI|nr:unnamed protein product [Paramecium pentaurelia]